MKKIYIDVTNIPELEHYTGISRVLSEIILRLVKDNAGIVTLSYSPVRHAYTVLDTGVLAGRMNGTDPEGDCYTDRLLTPDEFEQDSVFLEINSSWHTLPNRSFLLPKLKNRGIRIITFIYDIIPVRSPQYMAQHTLMKFMEYLTAHMTYADDIVVNTEAVRSDLLSLFDELGMKRKPVHVIGLGADFTSGAKDSHGEQADEEILRKLEGRRFLLTVSTIEPRKNHKVIVEAYEKKIASLDTDIVFVGRIGWEMEDLLERMKSNPNFDRGIYVFSGINDATLSRLYSMAYMVIFPSYAEGYGLSTIESMINGVPAVCSDLPVMREVGGRFCDYFPADDADRLAEIVESYVSSDEKYAQKKNMLVTEYVPPCWDKTVEDLKALIETEKVSDSEFVHRNIRQIVFLSARPAPILATLPYIEEFMPFLTELVVFCPDKMALYMKKNYKGRLNLTLVTDDELLAGAALPADHATRNFFLRCLAMRLDILDDEFIMSDDDYRPLGPVDETCFFSEGKYNGYYFSDLSTWRYRLAMLFSFDYAMFRTLEFLKSNGFPTLQYSSHQPQVINRRWYLEMLDEFPDIKTLGYDEWSTYFNYCAVRHSDHYRPKPYITLSWPNIGGENHGVRQSGYVFENFYKENYYKNGLFRKYADRFTCREYVIAENNEKKELAASLLEKFEGAAKLRAQFAVDYEEEEHMLPYFALYLHGDRNTPPVLGCPERYRIAAGRLTKLEIGISRDLCCAANIMQYEFRTELLNEDDEVILSASRTIMPRMEYSYLSFVLGSKKDGSLRMKITARNTLSGVSTTKTIPVEII